MKNKIKLLPEKVYNQIAAGEVIERPASIISELIDNAIDAGADEIKIILEGDSLHFTIQDNGSGILPDDLPLALTRHATSKIKQLNDIYTTGSLGFRGEALASIAVISKLEIVSSTSTDGKGSKLKAEGGKIIHQTTHQRDRGTTIHIRDIFYNTPVRKKFLKSNQAERTEIKKEIIKHVLSSDAVAFKYQIKTNGKIKEEINCPKSFSLKAKIHAFLGESLSSHLIPVSKQNDRYSISGFITSHRFKGKTRKDQYFIVKNRCIQNSTLSFALHSAYTNILPVRTHPACFLKVDFNPMEVDINVHPAKKEVKFQNTDEAYKAIYHVVKDELYQHVYAKQNEIKQKPYMTTIPPEQRKDFLKNISHTEKDTLWTEQNSLNTKTEDFVFDPKPTGSKAILSTRSSTPNFKIFGQLSRTYILYAVGDDFYIADQHAIHERINFDRLKLNMEEKELDYQYLLVPLVIEKGKLDIDIIIENKNTLKEMGLEFERFGEHGLQFERLPSYVPKNREKDFISDLIDRVIENKHLKKEEFMEKMISTSACRMSIMAGDELTHRQMFDLLATLYERDYIHNCPHGRPFIKKIPAEELGKFFDRH